jgi:NAD(P)-dependent dehydrogenase (short-subunit alcohol dehydrogenase family)
VFVCCHEIVPHMLEREKGVVINMSSIGARDYRMPEPVMSVYNMTKAAVMHLTRNMAKEWEPNVRVNCINAGHFLTPRRVRTETPERRAKSLAEIQVGRFGTPADIAAAAVFIASDAGAFFNASYLDLNGGV